MIMKGAFDSPAFGTIDADRGEMVEAGMFTSAVMFSGTGSNLIVSGFLVSPSAINPSGQLVVHGVSIISAAGSSAAFLCRIYGGSSGKTVAIGGGNRFGPYLYNFDQPVLLDKGEELIYHILTSFTGKKFVFINFSINEATAFE